MGAAILFRGHAHRPPGVGREWGVDWRLCLASHRRHLIEPLERLCGGVQVFLSTYPSDYRPQFRDDYRAVHVRTNPEPGTQRATVLAGLDDVREWHLARRYDLVAVCRFDLDLLAPVPAHPGFDPHKVTFLWREWNAESWAHHRRVPDALFFVPGDCLAGFRDGVAATPSETCLHLVHDPVAARVGADRVAVLVRDGYTDSNTDVMPNPFYRMVRCRP